MNKFLLKAQNWIEENPIQGLVFVLIVGFITYHMMVDGTDRSKTQTTITTPLASTSKVTAQDSVCAGFFIAAKNLYTLKGQDENVRGVENASRILIEKLDSEFPRGKGSNWPELVASSANTTSTLIQKGDYQSFNNIEATCVNYVKTGVFQ
jgi:hypothetical protein